MSGFVRTCVSGDGSLANDPLGGLTGHRCDPVEVGVVVQDDEVVHLGGRGDQEIGRRCRPFRARSPWTSRERFVTSGSIRTWGNWRRSAEICSYSVALRAL